MQSEGAITMGAGYGDRLARGGAKASFGSMTHVSDDKWRKAFGKPAPKKKKAKK